VAIPSIITADGESADVRDNALVVTVKGTTLANMPRSEAERVKLFTALLKTAAGSADLTVDGSSTPVHFDLNAHATDMRTITEVRLVLHSTNMDLDSAQQSRRFGPVTSPGLPNGLQLLAIQNGTETDAFLTPVQIIGHFWRTAGGPNMPAGAAITNVTDAIASGTDFLMVQMIPSVPIVLYPGSTDKIRLTVQDDLTGLVLFEVQAYGTREAP